MKLFRGLEVMPDLMNPVVAIGSFDGVHRGHCRILQQLVELARQNNGHSVVVTFDPHPREVLHPDSEFFRINSLERNLELMEAQQIDAVVVIPFSESFAQLSYAEFIESFVVRRLQARMLVMGPNHAMGHNRTGDHSAIEQLCLQYGIRTVEIPELFYHEAGVHSSVIRKCIRNNDLKTASELLGYDYQPSLDRELLIENKNK